MKEQNRWTAEEYREFLRTGKEPDGEMDEKRYPWAIPPEEKKELKYHNRPVEVDGIRFASKHEARVYEELMLRVKAGELRAVMTQVPFWLPGKIKYIADFVTLTEELKIEGVYDAKSEITRKDRTYINKKKQMKSEWGIDIIEV